MKDLAKGQKQEEIIVQSAYVNVFDINRVNMAPKPNMDVPTSFLDRVKIDIDIKTVEDLKK